MVKKILRKLKSFKSYPLEMYNFGLDRYSKFKMKRRYINVYRGKIQDYLNRNQIRKLHIGCGSNILSDWLNCDNDPKSNVIIYLDATKPYPLDSNGFDYIFSEHLIEHLSYQDGLLMLKECFRVLKDGGKIRISTPDLIFLIDLYKTDKSQLKKNYIQWATEKFIKDAPYLSDTFVINNFVRDWGHQFIYDEKTLRSSIEMIGFKDVRVYPINQSDDKSLMNLENQNRLPAGFLELETLTVEAKKPTQNRKTS